MPEASANLAQSSQPAPAKPLLKSDYLFYNGAFTKAIGFLIRKEDAAR
jgi:hypothetical protein